MSASVSIMVSTCHQNIPGPTATLQLGQNLTFQRPALFLSSGWKWRGTNSQRYIN